MSPETETAVERPLEEIPDTSAKPSWKVAVKRAAGKFAQDQCTDVAAMLTYHSMLALFPGLIAVISLIGVFNIKADTLINILADITGKSASDSVFDTPRHVIENFSSTGGATVALVVGVLGAIWSASGYVGGFSRALNRIYDVGEGRSIFKLRPWLYLVTAIEVLLIVLVLTAIVFSGSIAKSVGKQIGLGDQAVQVWDLVKWPFVCLIVVLIICLLYWATPNVRKPRRMFLSWGALVGFLVWVLASIGFGLYLTLTGGSSYSKTYGPFAGVVAFLLWLWITNLAMLFGAELDAELERTRELGSGLPAEEMILLPARDDTGLIKKAEKYDGRVQEAHQLRLDSGTDVQRVGDAYVPALAVRRSDERTVAAMSASPEDTTRPATRHVDGTPESLQQPSAEQELRADRALGRHDPARERALVEEARVQRRDAALVEAAKQRKVRDRLAAQEAKAQKAKKEAEKKAEQERKAKETEVTREERWAQVEQVRARYEPRMTPARADVLAQRAERRASFAAAQAEKAAHPEPKQDKPKPPPMPSELRTQIEQERAERRTGWYADRRPGTAAAGSATGAAAVEAEEIPQFRRDKRRTS